MCVCAGIVIDESPKTAGGTYEPSNSQVSVPIFGGIFVKLNQFAVAPGNETWLAGPLDEFDVRFQKRGFPLAMVPFQGDGHESSIQSTTKDLYAPFQDVHSRMDDHTIIMPSMPNPTS